jgi:hypothetical protein
VVSDLGTTARRAARLLNGAPLLLGHDNFIDAAQLSKVTYRGGASRTIYVRASDGLGFGPGLHQRHRHRARRDGTSANVIVSRHSSLPPRPCSPQRRGYRQRHAIDFWDYGTTGSTWLLNGAPLLLGHDNFVDAAQLSGDVPRRTGKDHICTRQRRPSVRGVERHQRDRSGRL